VRGRYFACARDDRLGHAAHPAAEKSMWIVLLAGTGYLLRFPASNVSSFRNTRNGTIVTLVLWIGVRRDPSVVSMFGNLVYPVAAGAIPVTVGAIFGCVVSAS
jgi:hypothetical protein